MTTVWRKKAYDMFGFKAGSHSYAHGKVGLFADLFEMVKQAARDSDAELLDRIFEYVLWADQQDAENLRSASDISFFFPMLKDASLVHEAEKRLPHDVIESRRAMTMESAD